MLLKKYLKKVLHNKFILIVYNKLFNCLKINSNNKIIIEESYLHHCKINVRGENNVIEIKPGCRLKNMIIDIYGNSTYILIDCNVMADDLQIWCEDENNEIKIGRNTTIHGKTKLSCIEGTQISIGQDCMFSSEIVLTTGDSHSILDSNKNRINPSLDIIIEDHVWIGQKNIILKGTHISKNSIVGANSLCTKKFMNANSIIAGVPAKIIKENISWDRQRLPIK